MRTRTKYQETKSDIAPDDNPVLETQINGVAAAPSPGAAVSVEAPPEPAPDVAKAEQAAAEADLAAYALKRQIDAMRQAEQQQRLQYERVQLASQPLSRDEKLEQWKTQGLTAREALFLREHPTMIDHPEVASFAANEAIANGIERDSPEYWQAVEAGFDKAMSHMRARSEALEATPEFFQPPAPKPKPVPSAARFVSAPVSREAPSSTPRPVDPSRVTLSVTELEIAKNSGISPTEYARGKLRLEREKAAGERQT